MLQKNALEKNTLELLIRLQSDKLFNDFILAGGTGLALYYGHRKSVDIYLFAGNPFDEEYYLSQLENSYGFNLDLRSANTLKGTIGNVKVDFIAHQYKSVRKPNIEEGLRIFSIEDIAAMKINAIAGDGTRVKDFIDLYFLLKVFDLEQIITFFEIKYNQRNPMHAIKSIIYFDDVILSEWPEMLTEKDLSWKTVKIVIENKYKEYLKNLNPLKNDEN